MSSQGVVAVAAVAAALLTLLIPSPEIRLVLLPIIAIGLVVYVVLRD